MRSHSQLCFSLFVFLTLEHAKRIKSQAISCSSISNFGSLFTIQLLWLMKMWHQNDFLTKQFNLHFFLFRSRRIIVHIAKLRAFFNWISWNRDHHHNANKTMAFVSCHHAMIYSRQTLAMKTLFFSSRISINLTKSKKFTLENLERWEKSKLPQNTPSQRFTERNWPKRIFFFMV